MVLLTPHMITLYTDTCPCSYMVHNVSLVDFRHMDDRGEYYIMTGMEMRGLLEYGGCAVGKEALEICVRNLVANVERHELMTRWSVGRPGCGSDQSETRS